MKNLLEAYLNNIEQILNFSDIAWWLIDCKNDPEHFYCNKLMSVNFNLPNDKNKHPINSCDFFDDFKDCLKSNDTEYSKIFPFLEKKRNEIKYFSSRAKILKKDDDGNIEYIYGFIENITKEVNNKNSVNEYVDIIDKNVIISTTDTRGIITNISTAYCHITGYKKNELIGKKHSVLKHPDTPRTLYRDMWKTVTSGKRWDGEIKNLRKDGSEFWIKLLISPTFDEFGNIKCYTTINQDITDKKIIENLSIKDTLTNVFNRRQLDNLLEKEISYAQRYNTEFSLISLDVDHFKNINDQFGHLIGDKILVEISNILKQHTRKVDHIGRWGGEEFLIICPNSNLNVGENVALKLKSHIEKHDFKIFKNITASFGISQYKKGDNIDDILNRADNALYKSKNNGRNQVNTLI
jgi:diguanylate cyclase (GGDEF)-like protein/PAS domain S-box-containing protein